MRGMIADAECGVIGGLLLYPDELGPEALTLDAADFSCEPYAALFGLMAGLIREGGPLDGAVILSAVREKSLELAQTAMRCMELFLGGANYKTYVELVKRESCRRRVRKGLEDILLDRDGDPLERAGALVEAEQAGSRVEPGFAGAAVEYVERLYHPEQEKRFATGFVGLDRALGGLMPGTLSYVGARPSTGKTAFALNVAGEQLKAGRKVLFLSLEMSVNQILDRLLADLCGIEYAKMGTSALTGAEKEMMVKQLGVLSDSGLFEIVDDVYSAEAVPGLVAKHRPEFVVVDFIQCMGTVRRYQTRRAEIDAISAELKRTAKRYKCHVMCLSQIARAGMDAPRMSDLKESGALEQDGDYILLLHRPFVLCKDNPDIRPEDAQVLLDKNKYGVTGMKRLYFDGPHQRFTERSGRG